MARTMFACGLLLCIALSHAASVQLSVAGQAKEQALEESWSTELAGAPAESKKVAYKSPIERVIGLLEKMKAELEAEAAKEMEMYDKMVCWCETNEKEKTKAIADGEAKDKELVAEIATRSARYGVLSTEIANMKDQIAEDTAALKEATQLREKEAAEFMQQEKETVQALANVKNAIRVLSRNKGASFLQADSPILTSLKAVLRDAAYKYEMLLGDTPRASDHVALLQTVASNQLPGVERALLDAMDTQKKQSNLPLKFAQMELDRAVAPAGGSFLQQQADEKEEEHAPSDAIFGIMKTMKEEFETNLANSKAEETKAASDFEAMSAAKAEQIETGKQKLDEMEEEHATNIKAKSDAKEDLELTRKTRTEDVAFLRDLKVTCQDIDRQWAEQSKARADEMKAVTETIAIVTSDDAKELMTKTVSLVQEKMTEGSTMRMTRARVAAKLGKVMSNPLFDADDLLAAWHSRGSSTLMTSPRARLSTLAVSAQLDGFAKVKAAMDDMVKELKTEQQEEVEFKAYCEAEFDKNEKETFTKNKEKEDLEGKMDQLGKTIKQLTKEIADAKKQIADTEVAIKKASETREAENAEYQTVVADQRATQTILKKAVKKLESFYKKAAAAAALVQQTPPGGGLAPVKKNAGAGPVMGMIEDIIEDSKELEAEAVAGEKQAQADYEKFVKDSNALISDLSTSVEEKTKAVAAANLDLEGAKSDHESAVSELEALAGVKQDLHGECDFVLKNFEVRQKARLQEMEAIAEAKQILSGAGR
eukprot:gnl/TRDRNA2_/TRDRNA2_175597_c0_seq32.p1 gnl/TRDRNA2_/TRDRNA2_175597_c0~~gnl/TRDRNA2_/TRDRNA2_175597_c0_seq32.p1  ORF type:complete len:766 (-),score=301.06 gnl/TRDRNA2_/TRDRNA2_175597_c0_seq32:99-2396(-)